MDEWVCFAVKGKGIGDDEGLARWDLLPLLLGSSNGRLVRALRPLPVHPNTHRNSATFSLPYPTSYYRRKGLPASLLPLFLPSFHLPASFNTPYFPAMLPTRLLATTTTAARRAVLLRRRVSNTLTTPLAATTMPIRYMHRSHPACSHDDSKPDPVADAEGFDFHRIGLVGGGKMSEAIIEGFLKEELIEPGRISVYDVNRARLDYLKKEFAVGASSSLSATCKKADLVIIAVKPQNLTDKLWAQLRGNLPPQSVVLSIVAGKGGRRGGSGGEGLNDLLCLVAR